GRGHNMTFNFSAGEARGKIKFTRWLLNPRKDFVATTTVQFKVVDPFPTSFALGKINFTRGRFNPRKDFVATITVQFKVVDPFSHELRSW
ncbi:MAG: hypothetical protein ACI923_002387, partial [Flavobacteriales bacterium]